MESYLQAKKINRAGDDAAGYGDITPTASEMEVDTQTKANDTIAVAD